MVTKNYPTHKTAALALLNGDHRITRKEGGFLGQLVADPSSLSVKQASWLSNLLNRAGLHPFNGEAM